MYVDKARQERKEKDTSIIDSVCKKYEAVQWDDDEISYFRDSADAFLPPVFVYNAERNLDTIVNYHWIHFTTNPRPPEKDTNDLIIKYLNAIE